MSKVWERPTACLHSGQRVKGSARRLFDGFEFVWWVWEVGSVTNFFTSLTFLTFSLQKRGWTGGAQWVFNGCRRAVVLTEATVYLFNTLNVFRWNLFNTLNVFRQNLFNALNVFRQNLFNALNVFPIWHRVFADVPLFSPLYTSFAFVGLPLNHGQYRKDQLMPN